jgi:hypothetical protein
MNEARIRRARRASKTPPDVEFLEKLLWALDNLARLTERRGHKALSEPLALACEAARAELRACQPPPARIASGRMRALWRHEGRNL